MPANPTCFPVGPCDTIRFQIIGQIGFNVVEGMVLGVPAGYNVLDVPGIQVAMQPGDPGFVTIYDPNGCFFNEPAGQLTGRTGFAKYMQSIGPAPPDTGPGTYFEPEWEVISLCCNIFGCR